MDSLGLEEYKNVCLGDCVLFKRADELPSEIGRVMSIFKKLGDNGEGFKGVYIDVVLLKLVEKPAPVKVDDEWEVFTIINEHGEEQEIRGKKKQKLEVL